MGRRITLALYLKHPKDLLGKCCVSTGTRQRTGHHGGLIIIVRVFGEERLHRRWCVFRRGGPFDIWLEDRYEVAQLLVGILVCAIAG